MKKEDFLDIASKYFDSINNLNELDNFFDYEKDFVTIWRKMGQEILTANLGKLPNDKRKKKTLQTTLGPITINNSHKFSGNVNGFRYSPFLQDMIAYAGQLDVYGKGNEVLGRFLGIEVSAMQVNRMTDYYGERCGDAGVLLTPGLPAVKGKEVLYVAVDGSMLFTRDDGWKEVKVARIFKSSDCIDPNGKASWIRHSQYYGLLGGSGPFTGGVETILDGYNVPQGQLVFLSDGAQWIRNWVEDAFPGSVAILDYYHALEHLHKFKAAVFGDKEEGAEWAEKQASLLLESQTDAVISNIRVAAKEKDAGESEKLIGYYEANKKRMDYKRYKTIGAGIIGSGAVESAHRTLIQDRMKNAGQRWSNRGAKHMIDLKTMYLNEKWNVVTGFAKNYDKAA